MKGDFQARFRENVGVQFPYVTRLCAISSTLMEKFIDPSNIQEFIKWLLDEAAIQNWKCVVEYSNPELQFTLIKSAVVVELPKSITHNYSDSTFLTAFQPKTNSLEFIQWLIKDTHVLSIYQGDVLLVLIADDYHQDCFSCSMKFYNQYNKLWRENEIINS